MSKIFNSIPFKLREFLTGIARWVLNCLFYNFLILFQLNILGLQMTDYILSIKKLAYYLKLNEMTTCRFLSKGEIIVLKIKGSRLFERLFAYICTKLGDCKIVFFN